MAKRTVAGPVDAATDTPDAIGVQDTSDGQDTPDITDTTDAEPGDVTTDAADVADTADVTDPVDPTVCECDTSVFCEEGCACDVACGAEIGEAPLGVESVGIERNEMLLFHANATGDGLNRMSLYDDGAAGGAPRFPILQAAAVTTGGVATESESIMRPMALTGDVDNDGRDETVVVSATDVSVVDWDGTSLTMRIAYRHEATEWFDAALGDLANNGGRLLAISRQAGDVVTAEVLDLSGGGDAIVRATTEVTGVSRHALAIGARAVGEPSILHLLTTPTWTGIREPGTMHLFALEGEELSAVESVEVPGLCSTLSQVDNTGDGMTLLVGEIMQFPARNEWFVAEYCPAAESSGAVLASFYDQTGRSLLQRFVGTAGGTSPMPTRT